MLSVKEKNLLPSLQVALVATPFDQLMVATPEVRNLTVHVKKSRFVAVIFHVVFTSDDIVCFFCFLLIRLQSCLIYNTNITSPFLSRVYSKKRLNMWLKLKCLMHFMTIIDLHSSPDLFS